MANTTKVSTTTLPMSDIAELLNTAYDFVAGDDSAADVDKVAGIESKKIAIAVDASDRETVKNALNLNNVPAEDYMKKSEGGIIATESFNIKTIYNNEIAELRDEIYQLKEELSKSGVVTNYKPYSGFYDVFRNNYPMHLNESIAINIDDSLDSTSIILDIDDQKKFDLDDWIILSNNFTGQEHVAKITEIKTDGQTIVFEPSCSWQILDGQVDIYKSLGMSENGAFCFFKKSDLLPDSKDMHSCLNDDTYRLRRKIVAHHTGFGYTFRIPETQKGFLTQFEIQVKTHGTPGALMCYIIDERDIKLWKNAAQAESDGLLLAKSQPLIHDASLGERIANFNFWNGIQYPLLNEPDTVDHKVRYCAIIEALDADSDTNFYELVFLQNKKADGSFNDLQLNNIVYSYEWKESASLDTALKTDSVINSSDMYFGITTRGVINNGFVPYREGVYTAAFKTPEPITISQARLMMRIGREGHYLADLTVPTYFTDNSSIPVKKDADLAYNYDMNELGGFGFKQYDDSIIIGTNIRTVSNQTASNIVVQEGFYAEPNDIIYRAGYKVSLKARHIVWNPDTCKYDEIDKQKIDLPLIAVMPDKNKKNVKHSDRLIYTNYFTDAENKPRFFNDFELQIHWNTEYSGMYSDSKYKEDFVGKIHNLVLSLDRNV